MCRHSSSTQAHANDDVPMLPEPRLQFTCAAEPTLPGRPLDPAAAAAAVVRSSRRHMVCTTRNTRSGRGRAMSCEVAAQKAKGNATATLPAGILLAFKPLCMPHRHR